MQKDRFWEAMELAGKMTEFFNEKFGRWPSEVEYKIAYTLFADGQRAEAKAERKAAGLPEKCPDCGGEIWDNRAKKKSGDFKKTAPDFSCKDKEGCGWVFWTDRKKKDNDDEKPSW